MDVTKYFNKGAFNGMPFDKFKEMKAVRVNAVKGKITIEALYEAITGLKAHGSTKKSSGKRNKSESGSDIQKGDTPT